MQYAGLEWFAGEAATRGDFNFGQNFRLTVETPCLPVLGGDITVSPTETVVCPLLFGPLLFEPCGETFLTPAPQLIRNFFIELFDFAASIVNKTYVVFNLRGLEFLISVNNSLLLGLSFDPNETTFFYT